MHAQTDKQFKKYDVARLRARHTDGSDRRPETYHPSLDTLVVGPHVDADSGKWQRRGELLGDLVGATTSCEPGSRARAEGQAAPSLGLVKPTTVDLIVGDNPDYRPGGDAQVDVDLFGNEHEVLEKTPFTVTYKYRCAGASGCRGHERSIIDWESGQLAGRNLATMSPTKAKSAQREQLLDEMCAPSRDPYFFVGNQHQHPGSFLVLGLFHPRTGLQPALQFDA